MDRILNLAQLSNNGGVVSATFYDEALKSKYDFYREQSWQTSVLDIHDADVLGSVSMRLRYGDTQSVFLKTDLAMVYIYLGNGYVNVQVAAYNQKECERLLVRLLEIFPLVVADDHRINVNFSTSRGGYSRMIDVPRWDEIGANYPLSVRGQIDHLITRFNPNMEPGRLILWRGKAGTGKTYALRALGHEWRKWADLIYIVEPEAFFSGGPYMMQTLLQDSGPGEDKWKVIVAEDAGEMLAKDAKMMIGQGLSRLLNIVDGLLGQGLKVLVLITTNEEMGKLHEAVARPGRAVCNIEFKTFTKDEAERWLVDHGVAFPQACVPTSPTLAELYARLAEETKGQRKRAA